MRSSKFWRFARTVALAVVLSFPVLFLLTNAFDFHRLDLVIFVVFAMACLLLIIAKMRGH